MHFVFFCSHFRPIEVCERDVLCGFRAHSSIPKSEVDPPANDVSYDFFLRWSERVEIVVRTVTLSVFAFSIEKTISISRVTFHKERICERFVVELPEATHLVPQGHVRQHALEHFVDVFMLLVAKEMLSAEVAVDPDLMEENIKVVALQERA